MPLRHAPAPLRGWGPTYFATFSPACATWWAVARAPTKKCWSGRAK